MNFAVSVKLVELKLLFFFLTSEENLNAVSLTTTDYAIEFSESGETVGFNTSGVL